MAMRNAMTKEQALDHAKKLAVAFGKFGAQIKVPYTIPQLLEVIAILHEHGNWDAPTTEELTKVKRQLTAALAREAKCKGKSGDALIKPMDVIIQEDSESLENS